MRGMTGSAAALLMVLAVPPAGEGEGGGVEFRLQYIPVHGRRQESVFYDFDGDGRADLLNVSVDFDRNPPERWLGLHCFRGGFPEKPDRIWPVSDRACALAFGDFLPGGGTEIGYVAEDGLWVYPPAKGGPSETPVKLLHARTFFRVPSMRNLPVWWWRTDLDGDGRDDLVLPLAEGYRVHFQTAPGIFGRSALLEADLPEGTPRTLAAASRADFLEVVAAHFLSVREIPRIQPVDIDGDGRQDVVTILGETLHGFFQKAPGEFPSRRPHRVSFSVPTLKEPVKKDTVNVSLVRFVDFDQDGIADLVVTRIEGTVGLWDSIKTSVYLHRGTGRGNFSPDKRVQIDGVSIDPEFLDMNGDGKLDLVTSRLRTDLVRQAVDAFVLGDIAISYEVFQFDPGRETYFPDPVYEKRIFVARGDLEKTGAGAVPLVFIRGDLSGDGRPDQIVIDPRRNELDIHPGVVRETHHGPRIGFDGTAHWTIRLERHPKMIAVADVNGDGVGDILLFYSGRLGLVLSRKGD